MPQNLRFPKKGGIAVSLWDQWPDMLADACRLGRVLVITGNRGAALGHYRTYPELSFGAGQDHCARAAGIAVDLDQWGNARAREERDAHSVRYTIEMTNTRNEIIHKICLTQASSFPEFMKWVNIHQAAGINQTQSRSVPVAADSIPDHSAICREAVLGLLRQLMEFKMPVSVAVGNDGVSQRHAFAFRELRESGNYVFCSDEDTGWHLSPALIHALQKESCTCRGGYRLRALGPDGATLFALSPASKTDLSLWNGLVSRAAAASETSATL